MDQVHHSLDGKGTACVRLKLHTDLFSPLCVLYSLMHPANRYQPAASVAIPSPSPTFASSTPSLNGLKLHGYGIQTSRRRSREEERRLSRANWLGHVTLEASDLARLPLSLSLSPSPHSRLLTSPLSALRRVGVASPLFCLGSTLDAPTWSSSTPQLIVVEDLVEDALVRAGSRSTFVVLASERQHVQRIYRLSAFARGHVAGAAMPIATPTQQCSRGG
ncbi:hypothetical protein JCM10296v2_002077 [Rhodotorula toruloides]